MMRKGSIFEAEPHGSNAGSNYLWPPGEPIAPPIAQKRTGLVRLRISNDINRKRLVTISAPIRSQRHGLGCGLTTMMSFYGTPVAQVIMEMMMSLFRGNRAVIRSQAGNELLVDVNAHMNE